MSAVPEPGAPVPFGRYELLELVGEGAMAQVYRARRVGLSGFRKEVAIKRLRPGTMGRDEHLREALINEARNGGLLRHPGIVEIHEFDHVGDDWYLAMEFVDGWTLEEVLWRAASEELPGHLRSETGAAGLAQAIVLDLARQMAHALCHAHEARDERGQLLGLVHRDLKPANVFLARDGVVKLADFGLAKSRANLRQTADADRTKGSPLYMSPEQVSGEPLDARSDLFALGTIVVELSVGTTPFEGATVANTLVKVMGVDWTETEVLMGQRAPALLPLVQRLLQKDPADRWPSARALAAELDAFAASQPLGAGSRMLSASMAADDPTVRPEPLPAAPPSPFATGETRPYATGETRPYVTGEMRPYSTGETRPYSTGEAPTIATPDPPFRTGESPALGTGEHPDVSDAITDPAVSAVETADELLDEHERDPASWGLVAGLVALLLVLMAVFLWVLRQPGTSGDFAGIREPLPRELEGGPSPVPPEDGALAHTPPRAAQMWKDLNLKVLRRARGTWEISVGYRTPGQSWRLVPLSCGDRVCEASLPVTSDAGIEYHLDATGPDGASWRYGSAEAPVTVPVR